NLEEASAHFAAAVALDPRHARSLAAEGRLLARMNRAQDAVAAFDRLRTVRPENLAAALDATLTLPMVYRSTQEMAACRAHYTSELERLEVELPGLIAGTPTELKATAHRVNLHLAYQGDYDLVQ